MTAPYKTTPSVNAPLRWLHSLPFDISLLGCIVLIGIYLRGLGINHGTTYHPDERHMIMVTEQLEHNSMNPNSFAYGSFSFYALWIFARLLWFVWSITGGSGGIFTGMPDPTHYDGLLRSGRVLCLILGVIAIPLLYSLALKLYRNSIVGLLAAALLSVNVFHIQLSRFFTSDITLTTLSLASLLALVSVYEGGSLLAYLTLGVFLGLATATKISSVFLATPLVATVILAMVRDYGWRKSGLYALLATLTLICISIGAGWVYSSTFALHPLLIAGIALVPGGLFILALGPLLLCAAIPLQLLSHHLGRTALALAVAASVFVVAEPYAVLDYSTFIKHTHEQTSMVRGDWRPPYTIQYEHTVPYFYHLKQMLWYTMGAPVFLLVTAGFIGALVRTSRYFGTILFDRTRIATLPLAEIIPMIFMLVFFGATAGFQVKFPRYLMPLYPVLFLFAASIALYGGGGRENHTRRKT